MIPKKISNFFLTEVQLQKLAIIRELKKGEATFTSLQEKLGISKRRAKDIVTDIIIGADINGKYFEQVLSKDKERVYFIKNLSDIEYVEMVNNFREQFISESSLFRTLLFVLEKRKFTILDMSLNLIYSESYSYKLLDKLKAFIKLMNLDIELKGKIDGFIELVGNESTIRTMHYSAVSIASKGNTWFFKTISQTEIVNIQTYVDSDRYKNLSPVGKNKINSILAVYEVALRKGRKIHSINNEVLSLGNSINKEKELGLYLRYLKKQKYYNPEGINIEIIHLSFLANYFMEELRTEEEKEEIGKYLHVLNKNSIVSSCIDLLDKISIEYNISKKSRNILLYNLCNRLVGIHYLGFYKFISDYKIPPISGDKETFIEQCFEKSLKEYKNEESFEKIKLSFTKVLNGYLTIANPNKQKVYVEFFYRPEYKSVIENAIEYNYNPNVLQITDNYVEADIIISDTHGYNKDKYFYFKEVFNQESWGDLGFYLNNIIAKNTIEFY